MPCFNGKVAAVSSPGTAFARHWQDVGRNLQYLCLGREGHDKCLTLWRRAHVHQSWDPDEVALTAPPWGAGQQVLARVLPFDVGQPGLPKEEKHTADPLGAPKSISGPTGHRQALQKRRIGRRAPSVNHLYLWGCVPSYLPERTSSQHHVINLTAPPITLFTHHLRRMRLGWPGPHVNLQPLDSL